MFDEDRGTDRCVEYCRDRCRKCCTCKECLRMKADLKLIEKQFEKLTDAQKKTYAEELLSQEEVKDELRLFVEDQV
jgi:hypothetical protein